MQNWIVEKLNTKLTAKRQRQKCMYSIVDVWVLFPFKNFSVSGTPMCSIHIATNGA